MRKTIAKAVTWRIIGTTEIFAISFWTTGHIATAGHTAGIAAITSLLMYVVHELAWREDGWDIPAQGSRLILRLFSDAREEADAPAGTIAAAAATSRLIAREHT